MISDCLTGIKMLSAVSLLWFFMIATGLAADTSDQKEPAPLTVIPLELETAFLWDGPAPNAKGDNREDRPRLYVTRPEPEKATGAAVIVCPGGGYGGRAMEHEGVRVCHWLNDLGITAFLLAYRVRGAGYTPTDSYTDAARAVRFVRHHAADYDIDPHRIGMIGFSAGGHLITRLGLHHDAGNPKADDLVERQSSRPDFLLLCYTPTAAEGWPQENLEPAEVTAETPPTCIFHTTEDDIDPQSVIEWYQGLHKAGVEAELHIFGGYGPHGYAFNSGDPGAGRWAELAANWMRSNGFLSGKERTSIEGMINIDGKPMYIGYITFIPLESNTDPVACGMVSGWIELGKYSIPTKHGPAPGLHRVEVRHTQLDPGAEPVMAGEVLYTKYAPYDDRLMTVEIKPGGNVINFEIKSKAEAPR